MRVSVIIPVYNTENYIQESVESALAQTETAEVIIIEDGSQDNSLSVCARLADANPLVRVIRHPNGENRGYPASTNLGIRNSTCEYVAFLDSDDFYLPDRFTIPRELFAADPSIDIVYEAVGSYVEDEASLKRYKEAGKIFMELLTVPEIIPSEQLFFKLFENIGTIHTNGMVVKKNIFKKTGYYDEDLRLHQDTAMNVKMAAVTRMVPGRLKKPVAMYRIHGHNRVSEPRPRSDVYQAKVLCWAVAWLWSKENLEKDRQELVLRQFLLRARSRRFNRDFPSWSRSLQNGIQLLLLLFNYPSLIKKACFGEPFYLSFSTFEQFKAIGNDLHNKTEFLMNKIADGQMSPIDVQPFTSVVVLTRDRAEALGLTLQSLQAQDYANFEIVVINNCSIDHTPQVVTEFDVGYFRYTGAGISVCRQYGIEVSKGELVAMCDDDCRPSPDWLSNLVRRLCFDDKTGMVAGKSINVGFSEAYKGRGKIERNGKLEFVADPNDAEYFSSQNIVFRRSAVQVIGGYDPFFRTGGYEEIDIMTRLRQAGFKTVYEPSAIVEHCHVKTDHRSGRLFYSGTAVRLYFYLKLRRPSTLKDWFSFLGYETKLFLDDLIKLARPIGYAVVKLKFHRWPEFGVRLFNEIVARLAIPWLMWTGWLRRLEENKYYRIG